jgi:hypothetical protein
MSYDRKAFSAEPQTAAAIMGKRWEDLIDAAASATEEDSRDLTPVSGPVSVLGCADRNRFHNLHNTHHMSITGHLYHRLLLLIFSLTQLLRCRTP